MADVFWGTEFKMAGGSRVSAEKRHHNISAIVKDQVCQLLGFTRHLIEGKFGFCQYSKLLLRQLAYA